MASDKLNLGKTVLAFLQAHSGEKFTARQIAEWVFETFPAECQAKKRAARRWQRTQHSCSNWQLKSAHNDHSCRRSIPN
ncbi:hypothetical protein MAFF301524_14510 [Ralstonia pseudosolanacearum]|nr:hypothetical protein MAFF301524_14510 [Ralstonia pseudosolanacearum]